jgi:hypothetical protein
VVFPHSSVFPTSSAIYASFRFFVHTIFLRIHSFIHLFIAYLSGFSLTRFSPTFTSISTHSFTYSLGFSIYRFSPTRSAHFLLEVFNSAFSSTAITAIHSLTLPLRCPASQAQHSSYFPFGHSIHSLLCYLCTCVDAHIAKTTFLRLRAEHSIHSLLSYRLYSRSQSRSHSSILIHKHLRIFSYSLFFPDFIKFIWFLLTRGVLRIKLSRPGNGSAQPPIHGHTVGIAYLRNIVSPSYPIFYVYKDIFIALIIHKFPHANLTGYDPG